MKKFYRWIVNHSKIVFVFYGIVLVVCLICNRFVDVNYDINDYLPQDSASTVAIDVMEEEYEGGITNARVMVSDVSIADALEYKELIAEIEGVTEVTWLDDVISLEEPLETQDTDTVETYYKDDAALFSVTIDEEYSTAACDAIRELIGEDGAMTGSIVSTEYAIENTVSEITKIAAMGVAFALLMLILTTTSWAEPLIVLVGLGIAILINNGSNLIFGEISFVTNAAGSILQLAVSLDYSVFLMHRFESCRHEVDDPKEAMVNALCASTTSILSSGLTTVIGFLALCLMQFLIGPDLGLALAKGVAISLICVFTLMPSIFLATLPLIDKTRHRSFMPRFKGFGKAIFRLMIPFLVIFCIILVPFYRASNSNEYYYGGSVLYGSGTTYGDDTEEIEAIFGKSDTYVLLIPKDSTATESELSDALHEIDQITSIISYVDTVGAEIPEEYLDEGTLSQLNSENYTRMILTVDVDFEGDETFELVETIRDLAQEYYPDEWYLAGQGVSTYDLMDTITADMVKVNLVAMLAVFIVLLFSMRSLSLPVLLVLAIEGAIWINVGIPYFTGERVFYISYLIISSIQLGATVDYAILFTNRYLEYRPYYSKKESIWRTVMTCTTSIMTSASVLAVAGFAMSIISSNGLLAMLGRFLGIGTICSFIVVFFVLPGMLYVLDPVIEKTTLKVKFFKPKKKTKGAGTDAPAAGYGRRKTPPAEISADEDTDISQKGDINYEQ